MNRRRGADAGVADMARDAEVRAVVMGAAAEATEGARSTEGDTRVHTREHSSAQCNPTASK